MRFILFILVLITHISLFVFPSKAQQLTQTVRGQVIDQQSKATLIGANIVLLDSTQFIGAATDIEGKFRLERVPVGRHKLKISYLGYKEIVLNIIVGSGKEIVLNIEMDESVLMGREVVISAEKEKSKANNEMTSVSARSFTIEETNRYAGSMGDPARMAANYAGVLGSSDNTRNDIIIRGNSPTGVLWRLEGVDIPNPNHFALFGTTGGPVSILNNNVLSNSDFITGAFPAEYGNAVAGVFDLKMRTGNNEKREFMGQLGFNGLEAGAEGPINKKKNSSYLINYRYSTMELFSLAGISFGTNAIPYYQDLSFKFNFPKTKIGSIALFGIAGASRIAILDSERDTTNFSFGNAGNDVSFASNMAVGGLSHTYLINSTTYTQLVIAGSGSIMDIKSDSVNFDKTTVPIYRNESNQGKCTTNFFLNKKLNSQHNFKTGFIIDRINFNLVDSFLNIDINQFITSRNYQGHSYLLQPHFQWKYKITNSLVFNGGLHYQHYFFNNSNSLEPRAGLSWNFKPFQTLSIAYGLHSQLQMGYAYVNQVQLGDGNYVKPNENMGFTKSRHYVLAYDHLLSENLRLKFETYYQEIFDVPIDRNNSNSFSMLNLGADYDLYFPDSLINNGTGTNYGLELTVEKFFSNKYYYLFTTSLFESKYIGSDGVQRNTSFNGNWIANVLVGKEFKVGNKENKSKVFTIDAKVINAGGRRYTPIDLELSEKFGSAVYIDSKAYTLRYPDFFRADLKIGFRFYRKKLTQYFALDIQNVLNTKNIQVRIYDKSTNSLRTEYQLGFFPVALYKIEF
ncbi:MAG: TonB-dependent receptor [Bacteroidetes bacterium]|nr:TonB-dependent receptor [Bacteroidota bacterium]HET6243008.1 TonB-dependent receptor [Bacteroidia bacterium]